MKSAIQAVVCLMLAGGLGSLAFGLNPDLDINQYAHNAWTVRAGFLKGAVYAIAQTQDGYLWLGTELGLERFDGVRSAVWQPPKDGDLPGGRIRSLLATRDGRLWIGTDEGLASWKEGKLTHYSDLSGKTVLSILEDHEGTIWAAAWGVGSSDGRLCMIRDLHVECSGDDGTLSNGLDGLYEDRGGKLWAGGVHGVWRWKPQPAKFFPMPIVTSSFAEGDGGELFITTLDGIRTFVHEQAGGYLVRAGGQQLQFGKLLRDRDGGFWAGTYDGGLLHVHHGRIDRFTHPDGLSSDNVLYLFEDREGSIWVGTRNGLDRFREYAVPAITEKQGLSSSFVGSILRSQDGSMWLGTLNGLDRWKNGEITVYSTRDGLPGPSVLSLFEDQAGRIWVATRSGIAYLERGKFVRLHNVQSESAVCMVGDNVGGVWMSDWRGLYHLHGQTIVEEVPWAKLGHKDLAWTLEPDPIRGGVWLGFRQGGVAYYKDHAVQMSYGREQGFGQGKVSGLTLDDDGSMWAATGEGLSLIRNGRTFRLSSANGLPCDTVHWIVEDNDHFFWLYTACGVVRVARSELERWMADPTRKASTTILDSTDGVESSVAPTDSNPMVAKSVDGKIWFVTNEGVGVIDPRHLSINKLPPAVHIEQITADEKTYDATNGLRMPPGVRNLAIDYTALSLVAPEKVRFRYKLEGQNRNWHEVVNDREVQYTNLGPGNYRFRVLASNNSGVWNEEGAALDFVIPPMWYQTKWFYGLCAAGMLAMLWAAYQFRVRQLASEFNMRLDERVAERTRIARDLHDTLLQSFQGLVFRFQAARFQLPDRPEEASEALDNALVTADQAIAEGRSAIQQLRSGSSPDNNLEQMLLAMGRELASSQNGENASPPLRVIVEGSRRAKRAVIREEIYRIARELLRNAYRHAHAQNIEAELRYDEDAFLLIVRDDGKGIDSKVLKDRGRAGHWGLPGMYERAEGIGARIDIWSEAGAGTEVRLSVPGAIAYEKSGNGGKFKLFRRTRVYEHRS